MTQPAPEPGSTPDVGQHWYDQSFGAEYLQLYKRRDRQQAATQVDGLSEWLGLERGDRVLDLCCGAGRHLEFLRERGLNAWGLDRSAALLGEARRQLGPRPPLIRADMRRIPFMRAFDAVVSFFTSFGYFPTRNEDLDVARSVGAILLPGGDYVLDLMDPQWTRDHLVARSERHEAGREIQERRWIFTAAAGDSTGAATAVDPGSGSRVEKETIVRDAAGERRFRESVRLYSFPELRDLLLEAGFDAVDARADFQGSVYTPGAAPRMIVRARTE